MKNGCQQTECSQKNCDNCKHAISSKKVYCGKLKEIAKHVESCPHFEFEPPEYKLYRRM